jgi:hypothetical protein
MEVNVECLNQDFDIAHGRLSIPSAINVDSQETQIVVRPQEMGEIGAVHPAAQPDHRVVFLSLTLRPETSR